MKHRASCLFCVGIVCFAVLVSQAAAQAPNLLNFQGRLSDPSGNPRNGTFTMAFAVYDSESDGNQLPLGSPWDETQSVTVTEGVFNVLLGNVTAMPSSLFVGGPSDASGPLRYLQVTVDGETLTPRKRIASAAYAMNPGNTQMVLLNDAETVDVDWSQGTAQKVILRGNRTLTFANGQPGGIYSLLLQQDSAGGRIVTWPANTSWPSGAVATLTTTPYNSDFIQFLYDVANGSSTYDAINFAGDFSPSASFADYGTGSDGDVTISVDTSITRDMSYNNLTIDNGVTLRPNGYRIQVKGVLTNNGVIDCSGGNGEDGHPGGSTSVPQCANQCSNSSPGAGGLGGAGGGAANSAGTLPASLPGQPGGNGGGGGGGNTTVGSSGGAGGPGGSGAGAASSIGVAGAAGTNGGNGAGSSDSGAGGGGGSGGTAGAITGAVSSPDTFITAYTLIDPSNDPIGVTSASSGGGGGGGGGGGYGCHGLSSCGGSGGGGGGGGGSGAAGGVVAIYASTIVNSSIGTILAEGGDGGTGAGGGTGWGCCGSSGTGGTGGSGAGGSGGVVILVYTSYTNSGVVSVAGGTGGTGAPNGNTGTIIAIETQ